MFSDSVLWVSLVGTISKVGADDRQSWHDDAITARDIAHAGRWRSAQDLAKQTITDMRPPQAGPETT